MSFGKTATDFIRKLKAKHLVWDTLKVTLISSSGKTIGFLVPLFIAAWFGITKDTDIFFFSYGVIIFFSGLLAPVIDMVIVPFIAESAIVNKSTNELISGIFIYVSMLLLAGVTVMILILKPALVLITPYDQRSRYLAVQLILYMVPVVFFASWSSIFDGLLNASKRFVYPALSPVIRAVVILSVIFAFKDSLGLLSLSIGYASGEFSRLVLIYCIAVWVGRYRFKLKFHLSAEMKGFFITSGYQILGMIAVGLNPIVDRTMAAWLSDGGVSILHYADRIYMIPVTLLSSGLMITLLSHWSSRYFETGRRRLFGDLFRSEKKIFLMTLALTVLLAVLSRPLIQLAYGRSSIAETDIVQLEWTWLAYLSGLVPYILTQVYVRIFLILRMAQVILRCALVMVASNIVFNIFMMKLLGVAGLALSTSIVSLISFLYFRFRIKRITLSEGRSDELPGSGL